LRPHAGRLGGALRRELGEDTGARSAALRRNFSPHLAQLSLVLRGNVPLEELAYPSLPGDGQQGQPGLRQVSDEPGFPLRVGRVVDAHAERMAGLVAEISALGASSGRGEGAAPTGAAPTGAAPTGAASTGAAPVRLAGVAKPTSNLFRERQPRARPKIDLSGFKHVLRVDTVAGTVEAEGMITYVELADATLARGVMPCVVPQLKSITLGGAVAG